jgi:hypothetical protein
MSNEQKAKDVNLNVSPVRLDLTEPAKVFTERICDAAGGLARPWQIKRVARAEAQASIIKATTDIEINELQKRALVRFANEQADQQVIMETIVAQAAPLITETAKPNEVSNEWITSFFARCRHVSDEEMQALWAKVLAGEANSPGRYSKRLLVVLESLEKKEAEIFATLCRYVWKFDQRMIVPIVTDHSKSIYTENGITFGALRHFDGIGLVHFDPTGGFSLNLSNRFFAEYGKRRFKLTLPQGQYGLIAGTAILTTTGMQLFELTPRSPVAGLDDHVVNFWQKLDIIVETA